VIFGMPQEAIRAGAADKVLPLWRMAEEIAKRCRPEGGQDDETRTAPE